MTGFDPHKFDFSVAESFEAAAAGKLLSAEIEFNRSCNYRCPYCYAAGKYENSALEPELARQVIRDVAKLGARKIVVLGGEPLLCKNLEEYIELAESLGMGSEIFTNAALVDEKKAKFFYDHNCRVVIKLNSLRPEVQEMMTGVPHALDNALRALDILQAAGMDEQRLAASSVICTANEAEVVELWKYLRGRNVKPYLEIMTPQGRLLEHRELEVHPRRLKEIFDEIAAFDWECGFEWEPQPPLVGAKCLRHQYSCVVGAGGDVTPCVGLTINLGNVHEEPLADILFRSNIMRRLKNYRNTIKGPCRSCDKAESCYGCRGAAYQLTGDYLASDPLCWRNCDELLSAPPRLPCDARQFLPHRPPMTMVDTLLEIGEWSVVEATIATDNRFLRDGVLDTEVIPEIVAQGCAAITGFEQDDRHLKGMLTGIRNVTTPGVIRGGDKLHLRVRETDELDEYHILYFRLFRCAEGGEELCAEGEMSICRIP